MGADRIGKIARGQMRVILFRHARVATAKLLGYNVYWYAFHRQDRAVPVAEDVKGYGW